MSVHLSRPRVAPFQGGVSRLGKPGRSWICLPAPPATTLHRPRHQDSSYHGRAPSTQNGTHRMVLGAWSRRDGPPTWLWLPSQPPRNASLWVPSRTVAVAGEVG